MFSQKKKITASNPNQNHLLSSASTSTSASPAMPKPPFHLASRLSAALLPPPLVAGVAPLSRAFSTRSPLKRRTSHNSLRLSLRRKASPPPPQSSISNLPAAQPKDSTDWYPVYDRLLPCPQKNIFPRVEHIVTLEEENIVDFISRSLNLPPLYVRDLIQFGAVYYALVCPQPPQTATEEQIRLFNEVTNPEILKKRVSIKGKTFREAQKTFKVTDLNQLLEPGTYLRVHVHPKRFPRCYEIDWKSRIIAVTDSYVVLDKPAGTSVGGTTDNIEESCATFATRALGFEAPLLTTHQIDNCTEGCVVLSRTKEFCSFFHGLMREKQVKKVYTALVSSPVKTGIISHYMRPVNVAPRLVSQENEGRWHLCEMEILECKEVLWPNSNLMKLYSVQNCEWPSQKYAYECKINLLTGKTHQVRAQFAAIGAPIVGDAMYTPASIAEINNPSINPFNKNNKEIKHNEDTNIDDKNNKSYNDEEIEAWIGQHGNEPNLAIGLQASKISWDDGNSVYEAGLPWWRQEII
ncbi:hypothetical protein LUZ60_014024 [Juncus effusus]|nr:hypothetical protein LUZ60_014024 [Juncus effusus]